MTREELAKKISTETGLSKRDSENIIIAFGNSIAETLAKGDKVVYSNFGSFYTVHYPSKVIQHPKLGSAKKMVMLPTNAVKWMPSGNIKNLVKNGQEVDSPTLHGSIRNKNSDKTENKFDSSEEQQIDIKVSSTKKESSPGDDGNFIHSMEPESLKEGSTAIPIKVQNNQTEIAPREKTVFEETTNDGGREISTFNGTIKVHKPKSSFLNKIFGRGNNDPIKPEAADISQPVSLVGAGIFDNNSHTIPSSPNIASSDKQNFSHNPEASKHIEEIKRNLEESKKVVLENRTFSNTTSSISYIDLSAVTVPKKTLMLLPEKIAREYKAVPVQEQDGQLIIAMVDPEDIEAKEIIKKYTQKPILVKLATESDINHVLDQYQSLESEVKEVISVENSGQESEQTNNKSLTENISNNAPAARIVASMLRRAIRERASDIHIEPDEIEVAVRFRIDGILLKKVTLPKDIQMAIISRIKILCNMKIDEQRLPQDGRFSIDIDGRKVDFRVSTMPVAHGEKIVMRILDKLSGILTIEQLGLEGNSLENLNKNLEKTHGMILVTGPTGSGKTTTLYALIDKLFNESVNIVTLEDPIEYRMPGINQSQVNSEINYTFASGLRSIVRQDPDIIMIGEIRDGETADMAVHAALTGHIVLSTLHTNNAAGAAPRLIDMEVEPFLLTSTVNVIIGQRLARKICDKCKEEITVPQQELEKIKAEIKKMPDKEKAIYQAKEIKLFKGKGCKICGDSGYKGRIGLYEVLPITEAVKELILAKKTTTDVENEAIKEGMVTMLQDGIIKSLEGKTTIEEVWRVTRD